MKGPRPTASRCPGSVRFTWTGDYLHDAYWSTGQQGFTKRQPRLAVKHGPGRREVLLQDGPTPATRSRSPASPAGRVSGTTAGTEWFLNWHKFPGRQRACTRPCWPGPAAASSSGPSTVPGRCAGAAPLSHPGPSGNWSRHLARPPPLAAGRRRTGWIACPARARPEFLARLFPVVYPSVTQVIAEHENGKIAADLGVYTSVPRRVSRSLITKGDGFPRMPGHGDGAPPRHSPLAPP